MLSTLPCNCVRGIYAWRLELRVWEVFPKARNNTEAFCSGALGIRSLELGDLKAEVRVTIDYIAAYK